MVKDSKLLLDQVTYNIMIQVLSKHQHSDEALAVVKEAEERGFQVDKVEYSAVVDSFCKQELRSEEEKKTKKLNSDSSAEMFRNQQAQLIIGGRCRRTRI
ncbi:hypothetical protein LINGRAHAP2_LOCUS23418 [Linum grandiflorum]